MGPPLEDRLLALVGFMGAGKSTLGRQAAERLGVGFVDVDELVEAEYGAPVAEIFARDGEQRFRELEQEWALTMLEQEPPGVVALGGGAIESEPVREALARLATTVWLDVPVDEAWARARGTSRPLARDESAFRERYGRRRPLYGAAADFVARDVDDIVLAAAGIRLGPHAQAQGDELVADERVAELHGIAATHVVPAGEAAKTVAEAERLWRALRLDRGGTLVAVGGGSTTDVAGFVAATYMRGVDWVAVPSTLVGQVDAAIGGKTAIDLPEAKNLVGAFHWPRETVVDTSLLATLPEEERLNGLAEVVKTGLLAGEPLWELPPEELVRRCAAYKAAVCLRDPFEETGERAVLNLGHTFAHALEAAAGYALPHGRAVALGLLAALRLSGRPTDVVDELLRPEPVRVDPEAAWAALRRDKKAGEGGRPRLVLLDAPGRPRAGVELPEADVRAALDALIAR